MSGTDDTTQMTPTTSSGVNNTKMLVVGVMLAAVYVVCAYIPLTPFIGPLGVGSSMLVVSIFIAPLFGILLGPTRGLVFGLIAGVIATFVAPLYLFLPTLFLGPAISGLFTGLSLRPFTRVGRYSLPGPLLTSIYLTVIVILYEIPNWSTWWFVILYMIAAAVALGIQLTRLTFQHDRVSRSRYWSVIPLAFIGTMTDFSVMTMAAVYIAAIPAPVFAIIFPLMLVERLSATAVSSFIAAVLLTAFPDIFTPTTNS